MAMLQQNIMIDKIEIKAPKVTIIEDEQTLCQLSLDFFEEYTEFDKLTKLSKNEKWDTLINHLQDNYKVHRPEFLDLGLSNNDITYRIKKLLGKGYVNKIQNIKMDGRSIIYSWHGPFGHIDPRSL